jgi:hypothetical protein
MPGHGLVNYVGDAEITPILKQLIVESGASLRPLETGHWTLPGSPSTD